MRNRALLIEPLDEVYRGPAWHGPSVREALRGVTAAQAAASPVPERNSIWDLVLHLAHGRHLLIERLLDTTLDFPRQIREPWWPVRHPDTSEEAWARDLSLLDEYHVKLVDAIAQASDAQLARVPDGADQDLARQLLGMAVHDAYHAGQIRLISLVAPRNA